uniref:Uncharacterized protein n=1 Tax=Oryza barthii TaxID=65489 RepID=A0A0D3H4N7_9ORYZ
MKAKVVGGKGAGDGRRLTLAPGASANLWSQPAVPKETWGVVQGEEEDERNWWPEVLAATPCRTSPEVSTWDKKGCSRGGFSAPTKCYAVEPLCVPKPLALGSRFWALGDESSEDEVDREERRSEEEVQGGSVLPEESFVKKAIDQGFTVDEILKAGEHLLCMSSPPKLPVAHTCSIMEKAAAAPPAAVRSSLDDNAKTLKFLMNLDKREKEGMIVLMSPRGQCTSDIEASKRSVELLSKGGSEHKFVSFGLVQTSQTRERKQSAGEQSCGAQGERSRREVTMAWRGEGSGRSDGHGRERGDGFWEEEEEFFGARFDAGRLGFEPGYGFGQQGNHGWGQQRSGFRPRGSRSFGPRRGGFAGRPRRGGWENNRFSTKRFGERPLLKNEGRPGGGINKAGGGSEFAAKGEVGGGVSGGGGGASAGKGKVKHKMKESEIFAIASGILDVAVGKVMNEVCDMVMEETEQPIEEEELPLDSNLGDEEKGEQEQEQEQEELTLVENNIEEAFKERVARAANIKETVMTPKRSSARLGCNSGVHYVEKAWKNLELQQGNEVNSFLSFSNSSITSSLQNLGVLLGASSDEITDSVCSLKKTEVERLIVV